MSINTFSNAQMSVEELPKFQDVNYDSLAKVAPWEPFWQSAITFFLLLLIVLVTVFFNPYIGLKTGLIGATIILFLFGLSQWHNFTEHKHRGVAVREQDIIFKKGLFWRQRILLPYIRVQHMELHRNPIERKLGLSSLKIFTAGGIGVDLKIGGLESERAEVIKQYILERTKLVSAEIESESDEAESVMAELVEPEIVKSEIAESESVELKIKAEDDDSA